MKFYSNIETQLLLVAVILMSVNGTAWAQDNTGSTNRTTEERLRSIERRLGASRHPLDSISKQLDDLLWYEKLGEVAEISRVRYTGPPIYTANPKAQNAGNAIVLAQYVFIPRNLDRSKKAPLLVMVHGGLHYNFTADANATMVRELLDQGYVIIAPEYRGSSGFGEDFFHQLDYGGKEVEDVYLGSRWALAEYQFLDPARVAIFGFSHGGLIALLDIFEHPEAYKAAWVFAPVSNMALRAGTKVQDTKGAFSTSGYGAPSSIGASAYDNLREYVKRSPVYNADKLRTAVLIQGASNDSDVNAFEVEQLIEAFTVRNKRIEYKIFRDPPGEHHFLFTDTALARQARLEGYRFLARLLNPVSPVQGHGQ